MHGTVIRRPCSPLVSDQWPVTSGQNDKTSQQSKTKQNPYTNPHPVSFHIGHPTIH